MDDVEVYKMIVALVLHMILGIVISPFVAWKERGKSDQYWWAIISLLFSVWYLLYISVNAIANKLK